MEAIKSILPHTKLFINGQWVDPVVPKTFKTINPTDESVICEISEGDAADVDLAVKAAREAYDTVWSQTTGTERARLLFKLADLIERDADKIARLETIDMGKPFLVAKRDDVAEAAATIRYFAGWADKLHGKTIPVSNDLTVMTRHEPIGVVGLITPWNYPFMIAAWKLGPCLAAGNTCVFKQSEHTPLTTLVMFELMQEAGFPKGVVNLVNGFGHTVGNAMSHHNDIDKISFTGSTRVGRLIMVAAQGNLKKVSLELGGKSPNIVFADADLSKAVTGSVNALFSNMGQCCCAGSRLFVHNDIYDKFVEEYVAKVKELKVGSPFEDVDQGPLASKEHHDRVLSFIEAGKKEGAKLLVGGGAHGDKGFFVQPTVFADVKDDMCISKEEIFGPVVSIFKFSDTDEVIKRANNTTYGLAAGIWTQNISKALQVTKKLKAGTVWVNEYNYVHHLIPFGGYKQSGFGKDLSEYALQEFISVKAVTINHSS
ncbi:aldehyde dehydrogenase [Cavenderia fasciculata]|uniref:Aldehyde dehydrogenase n=1 Tax=Cavenderia fasciculata TaxID=261658 RepID=F4PK99_CACFS|nr:aldehyde dehydrogenase [Cavenderia fasciculata]EGG24023.1 aldehyde dehydrogenase [Cavenderia fasciculata]|eukprot:XP_004361874.1 aldehyde dehydrogenase [Cavenderia fasciculata]